MSLKVNLTSFLNQSSERMWCKPKLLVQSNTTQKVKVTGQPKANVRHKLKRLILNSGLWSKLSCECIKQPPPPPPLPHKSDAFPAEARLVSEARSDSPRKSGQFSTGLGKTSDECMFRSVTPVSLGDNPSDSNSAATVISVNEVHQKRPQAARQLSSPRLIDARATASASVHHQSQSSTGSSTGRAFAEPNVPYSRHSRRFYENPTFQTEVSNASASANASAFVVNGATSATTISATASATVTSVGAQRVYEPAVWDLSASRPTTANNATARPTTANNSASRPTTANNSAASRPPNNDPKRYDVMQPLALMEAGAVLSIASQLSSDLYTDDEQGTRDPLNYSSDNIRDCYDPINRPDPALGHYRDSVVSQDTSSVDAPPDLLPSPTIHSRLRLLLNKAAAHAESEASSDADLYGSVAGSEAMTDEVEGVSSMKQQITGLETMYREILRALGVDNNLLPTSSQMKALEMMKSGNPVQTPPQSQMPVRRRLRHFGQRSNQELKTVNKRVEKLESHVVTLAQCVTEISSDIHQIRLQNSMRGSVRGSSTRTGQASDTVTVAGSVDSQTQLTGTLKNMKLCMSDPKRLTKLKWFFGAEPPFLKEFLESLGYEKYIRRFENEHIGLMEMSFMTEDRLRTLGVPLGPRLRILEEIQNIFRRSNTSPSIQSSSHARTSSSSCLV